MSGIPAAIAGAARPRVNTRARARDRTLRVFILLFLLVFWFSNRPPTRRGKVRTPPVVWLLETQKGGVESISLNTAGVSVQANTHPKTAAALEKERINRYNGVVVQL